MILGTAGHIDHGKTTLVKVLTGVDTDRLPEEKRRGITIDLGFAPLVIDGAGTIGIVDVPGHEAFIRTMLAGASGIDIALLVIAADESVMPQTREHLDILSLLGVEQLIVAITKSDLVADEWMALVLDDVEMLLAPTSFRASRTVPVSARTGEGIAELRRAISDAAVRIPSRGHDNDLFRMPIDRVFTIRGTGTVATGTIWSGSVSRDAALILRPGDRAVRVRGVQTHGAAVVTANAGERAAVALAGCELADVARGSVLVGDSAWIGTSEIEAEIELAADSPRVSSRTRLRFHLGTADVGCRLAGARTIGGTEMAARARVRIVFDEPLVSRGGDRFVLRYPSPPSTIGGGRVVDPYPPKRRRLEPVEEGVPVPGSGSATDARLAGLLAAAAVAGIQLPTLPVRLGIPESGVASAARAIGAITVDGRIYATEVV
nr:selenocysteine-specific translation elongation factor [Gemmatimonadaceae bacterium]